MTVFGLGKSCLYTPKPNAVLLKCPLYLKRANEFASKGKTKINCYSLFLFEEFVIFKAHIAFKGEHKARFILPANAKRISVTAQSVRATFPFVTQGNSLCPRH